MTGLPCELGLELLLVVELPSAESYLAPVSAFSSCREAESFDAYCRRGPEKDNGQQGLREMKDARG